MVLGCLPALLTDGRIDNYLAVVTTPSLSDLLPIAPLVIIKNGIVW
jgi:hypothetical protein